MTVEELQKRLDTYPGPHPNEKWKEETDLTKCTPREKEKIEEMGLTLDDLQGLFNRGQVAHMLFGWRHAE